MPRTHDGSPYSVLVTSIVETDQDIWIGTRDVGLFRFNGEDVEPVTGDTAGRQDQLPARGRQRRGVDRHRPRHRAGDARRAGDGARFANELGVVPALALLRDRDSNLWIAAGSHGVIRANPPASRGSATGTPDRAAWSRRCSRIGSAICGSARLEASSAFVTACLRHMRDCGAAVGSHRPGPCGRRGRAWFAPTERGLYWLDGEHARPVHVAGLPDDVVYSLDGRGQTVWVGRQYGGLTRLQMTAKGPLATRYTERDGLAQDSVYVVHDPGDGTVWAGTLTGGVSHLRQGRFETFTMATGLVSNAVRAIDSRDGTMWFGTPDGVSRRSGGEWRSYRTRDGLPSDEVAALLVDRDGNVWAGTSAGLAVLRPGSLRFEPVALVQESVLALQDDQADFLWCATADRLFRVARRALLAGTSTPVREYDVADGLISRESVRRQRTLAVDARGRVWYATTGGLSMADPSRFATSGLPAVLRISDVSADETVLRGSTPFAVPSSSRRVSDFVCGGQPGSARAHSLSLSSRRIRQRLEPAFSRTHGGLYEPRPRPLHVSRDGVGQCRPMERR